MATIRLAGGDLLDHGREAGVRTVVARDRPFIDRRRIEWFGFGFLGKGQRGPSQGNCAAKSDGRQPAAQIAEYVFHKSFLSREAKRS